jgi:FtsZ-binding cell division protein ZapB
MAETAKKYIQNTYTADIQIVLKEDGRFLKNMVFTRYQLDKFSGQVISDGFTEVDAKDLKLLEQNGAFKLLVEKKKLVIKDEAPLKAGSFEQLLELKTKVKALEDENKALKVEIEKLKAGKNSSKGNKSDAAKAADEGGKEGK